MRATNVYEEKSLGISYSDDDLDSDDEEDEVRVSEGRVAIWGKYLMRHMRRQLSFGERASITDLDVPRSVELTSGSDIWWLALSLLLITIIERDNIMNTANATWFNNFAIRQFISLAFFSRLVADMLRSIRACVSLRYCWP